MYIYGVFRTGTNWNSVIIKLGHTEQLLLAEIFFDNIILNKYWENPYFQRMCSDIYL